MFTTECSNVMPKKIVMGIHIAMNLATHRILKARAPTTPVDTIQLHSTLAHEEGEHPRHAMHLCVAERARLPDPIVAMCLFRAHSASVEKPKNVKTMAIITATVSAPAKLPHEYISAPSFLRTPGCWSRKDACR